MAVLTGVLAAESGCLQLPVVHQHSTSTASAIRLHHPHACQPPRKHCGSGNRHAWLALAEEIISALEVLFIDEASMLSAEMLQQLDYALTEVMLGVCTACCVPCSYSCLESARFFKPTTAAERLRTLVKFHMPFQLWNAHKAGMLSCAICYDTVLQELALWWLCLQLLRA